MRFVRMVALAVVVLVAMSACLREPSGGRESLTGEERAAVLASADSNVAALLEAQYTPVTWFGGNKDQQPALVFKICEDKSIEDCGKDVKPTATQAVVYLQVRQDKTFTGDFEIILYATSDVVYILCRPAMLRPLDVAEFRQVAKVFEKQEFDGTEPQSRFLPDGDEWACRVIPAGV